MEMVMEWNGTGVLRYRAVCRCVTCFTADN